MNEDLNIINLNLDDLCKLVPLKKKEEIEIFKRLARAKSIRKKKELQDEIVKRNGRLVVKITSKYYYNTCGVQFSDLVQEGVIGLITAIRKFDYKRGYKFSTMATPWIRQSVGRCIAEHGRNIRLPVYKSDMYGKIGLIRNNNPYITDEEIAKELNISMSALQEILIHGPSTISLDESFDNSSDMRVYSVDNNFHSVIASDSVTDYDDTQSKLLAIIEEKCTAREARILDMRYGLTDGEEMTLNDVGEAFGLTRERIRQLEAGALEKLSFRKELRELL